MRDFICAYLEHGHNKVNNLDFSCHAVGSKIKVTSMIHMSWELLAVQLGYQLTGIWKIERQASASKKAA